MRWTRMVDGAYCTVGESFGVRVGYRVVKVHNKLLDRRRNWFLMIDGVMDPNGGTCAEMKEKAAFHHVARCRANIEKVNAST